MNSRRIGNPEIDAWYKLRISDFFWKHRIMTIKIDLSKALPEIIKNKNETQESWL